MVNCFYDDEGAKKGSLSSDDNWSVRAPLSVPIPEEIPQPVPLPPSVSSQLPLNVPQLLRERYHIKPREHILICTDENNDVCCDLSPSLLSKNQDASDHGSLKAFANAIGTVGKHLDTILNDNRPSPGNGEFGSFDAQPTNARAQNLREKPHALLATSSVPLNPDAGEPPSSTFNAAHDEGGITEEEPDDDFTDMTIIEKQIQIGDARLIDGFYETRFRQIQQLSCKTIAKAWIKTVESKKQVRHPYNGGKLAKEYGAARGTGGELTKPDWWPRFGCRHREPDHVKRDERIILLKHVLGLANTARTNDSEEITIEKLRRSTNEVSNSLGPTVMAWLDEVYYVRTQEVRCQKQEIDAVTPISVIMPDPKSKRRSTKKPEAIRTQQAKRKRVEKRTRIKRAQRRGTTKGAVVTPASTPKAPVEPAKAAVHIPSSHVSSGLDFTLDSSQCYKQELSPDFGKDVPVFGQRAAQSNYLLTDSDYTSQYPVTYPDQNSSSLPLGNAYVCSNESLQPTAYQSFNPSHGASSSPMNTGPPFHDTSWGSYGIGPTPQPEQGWPAYPPTQPQPNIQEASFALPFRPHNSGFAFNNTANPQPVASSPSTIYGSVPNPFHADYLASLRSSSRRPTNHGFTGAFDFPGPPGYHL